MVTIKQKITYLPDGSIDLPSWLHNVLHHYHFNDVTLLEKVSRFVDTTCKGLTTAYGQPCIEQSLEMAEIILDLTYDQEATAAAMMVTVVNHANVKIETLSAQFDEKIAKLVSGISHMNIVNNLANIATRNKTQIDRLRKALLALVSDIRVVLIKLAERTSLMRRIKNINPIERKRLAQETMDLYAPLANRLGIGQLKWELEDLSFHYINPEAYKEIATFLAERRIDREQRIQRMVTYLKEELKKSHINAEIYGRAKHIYSIFLKMTRKYLDYKNIYDASAIRILVSSIDDCYKALSIIHHQCEHLSEEFDDYISKPKPNGYRSIHTAIIDPDGKNIEIQIRTHEMHNEAEHGVAAHWVYKENKPFQAGYESKITFLRQLLAWHKDVAQEPTSIDKLAEQIFEERVYVFTPAGDILDLPLGATPLDFAYQVHSGLGHRCRGAKINGHIVPLSYSLQTGDQIEIIAAKEGSPSRDWLNKDAGYIKTSRARAKIAQWFRQQEVTRPAQIVHAAQTEHHKPLETPVHPHAKKTLASPHFQIAGSDDLLSRIARCCKPIPGDLIVGYITQGRGVSIHRKNCNNIQNLLQRHEGRLIDVQWSTEQIGNFLVDLQIRARSKEHLIKEVTTLLPNYKIELISFTSSLSKKNNMLYITLTIQISNLSQLQQLLNALKILPNIIEVKRIRE